MIIRLYCRSFDKLDTGQRCGLPINHDGLCAFVQPERAKAEPKQDPTKAADEYFKEPEWDDIDRPLAVRLTSDSDSRGVTNE